MLNKRRDGEYETGSWGPRRTATKDDYGIAEQEMSYGVEEFEGDDAGYTPSLQDENAQFTASERGYTRQRSRSPVAGHTLGRSRMNVDEADDNGGSPVSTMKFVGSAADRGTWGEDDFPDPIAPAKAHPAESAYRMQQQVEQAHEWPFPRAEAYSRELGSKRGGSYEVNGALGTWEQYGGSDGQMRPRQSAWARSSSEQRL